MSQVQDLLTPIPSAYHTDERAAIQEMAREFAMKRVLPVANELDPVQGESRSVRVLPRDRGALTSLDEHGEHHRPCQHGLQERLPAAGRR